MILVVDLDFLPAAVTQIKMSGMQLMLLTLLHLQ